MYTLGLKTISNAINIAKESNSLPPDQASLMLVLLSFCCFFQQALKFSSYIYKHQLVFFWQIPVSASNAWHVTSHER